MSEVKYCCRLDEETIISIGRNRSGIDSGEIDYTIMCDKFNQQDAGSLCYMISTMEDLIKQCKRRINKLKSEGV